MGVVKFFWYKHPKTGEMFSDQRMTGFEHKPIIKGGVECCLVPDYEPLIVESRSQMGIVNKNAEVFQKDSDYVKKVKPKFVKFKDGHREKYDPTKHF
ncbi:MAG: hypothetical protein J7L15_05885 [Clostridiales bacterium]|nr:hypothetical protein [Clostridiales bacterium]